LPSVRDSRESNSKLQHHLQQVIHYATSSTVYKMQNSLQIGINLQLGSNNFPNILTTAIAYKQFTGKRPAVECRLTEEYTGYWTFIKKLPIHTSNKV